MSEQKFSKTFAEAFRFEKERTVAAQNLQAKLRKDQNGVSAFRDTVRIVPLENDAEIRALKEIWEKIGIEKFDETELTPSFSPLLQKFDKKLSAYHGALKELFPCPGEVDPISVFWDISTKGNFDKELQEEIGPFRDISLLLMAPNTKEILGGIDFCVYVHKEGPATVQTNFTFLKPEYRGIGFMSELLNAQDKTALAFIKETRPEALEHGVFYGITEQNVPEAMDAETYILDKAHSMDPITRLRIWGSHNYARLKFRYVQPALGPDEEPCDFLSLNASVRHIVKDPNGDYRLERTERPNEIPAKTLQNHVLAFFKQSIDGSPDDPTAADITSSLHKAVARNATVKTVSVAEQKAYLDTWESRINEIKEVWEDTKPPNGVSVADLHQRIVEKRRTARPKTKSTEVAVRCQYQ
ncbi:MAG: hypothetical protein PHS57_02295 [Alphaproteobacteria bacterium]|nr:hypothetical protein [Alphaproteobacteria bacterium]